ncbi:MAG TPA: hypothetical protein VJY34_28295 [Roseiarcus sp.]|nr:hypothetical protein [Roseiarcus sp.]
MDLFPEIEPGINKLVAMWQEDKRVEQESSRPVAPPKADLDDDGGETIYVTSELFGKTFPMRVLMDTPAGMIVQQIQIKLGLPRQLDVEGRVGCRFRYALANNDTTLRTELSLSAQGVRSGSLLWLQTEMEPFSSIESSSGKMGSVHEDRVVQAGRNYFMSVVHNVGLGL